jgi:hypothetical protein
MVYSLFVRKVDAYLKRLLPDDPSPVPTQHRFHTLLSRVTQNGAILYTRDMKIDLIL